MILREDTSYLGMIVTSTAGRDSKRLFAIVRADESDGDGIVYIADGRLRRVEAPKKKKLKHLKFTGDANEEIRVQISRGELTNNRLHSILNEYRQV